MSQEIRYTRDWNLLEYLELISWILLIGLPFITSVSYFMIAPYSFVLIANVYRHAQRKTDLKNARNYFRVAGWSIRTLIINVVVISVSIVFTRAGDYFEWKMEYPVYYMLILIIIVIWTNYHLQNFVFGFRWYISGIKLPGHRSLLIPWRHITEVHRIEGDLIITVFGKKKTFRIHPKDRRAAEAFVRHYESVQKEKP